MMLVLNNQAQIWRANGHTVKILKNWTPNSAAYDQTDPYDAVRSGYAVTA